MLVILTVTLVGLHFECSVTAGTHRFVFDGGTGHTQVEFSILLDAGVDQGLNGGLFLEQQEGVT